MHLVGADVAQDEQEAARWLSLAAAHGDTTARLGVADLALRGVGGPERPIRVREWFEEPAEAGDLVAAFNLGVCLAEGVGVERDLPAAAGWMRRAAPRRGGCRQRPVLVRPFPRGGTWRAVRSRAGAALA